MVQPVFQRPPATAKDPAAQAGEPGKPRPVGRRGAARLRLAIPVRLVSTRATEPAVLLDLSRSSARIGLEQPLALGACLYFKVAKRDLFAEVVRPDLGEGGGFNGLVFDVPLADDVVLMVRRFAETLEQNERDSLRDKVRRWVSGQDRI